MNQINDIFFSPLGKEYCAYFYIVSVIIFAMLVIALITSLITIIKSKKKTNPALLITNLFTLALVYFQNRLLYSMCVN